MHIPHQALYALTSVLYAGTCFSLDKVMFGALLALVYAVLAMSTTD